MTAGASLDAAGITVTYAGATAVDEVDLTVAAGSWVAVIGPNGAGKSSLLKAIAGLVPAGGTVTVGGRTVPARSADRARSVVYVPQDPYLPPGMSVAEYVLLGRTAHLRYLAAESDADRARARDVLAELELDELARRDVTTLSGGEAQRATLARALAQDAPVLLLDEPTSALDLAHQVRVLELVERLRRRQGLTVLCAMHDLTLAGQFADRLVLLVAGRVVAAGRVDEVLTEDLLSRHYRVRVRVVDDPAGGRMVVPLRHREGR